MWINEKGPSSTVAHRTFPVSSALVRLTRNLPLLHQSEGFSKFWVDSEYENNTTYQALSRL